MKRGVVAVFLLLISPALADETVYVTRTGTKYHRAGWRHLSKSAISMPLSDAATRYGPCSACSPPVPAAPGSTSRAGSAAPVWGPLSPPQGVGPLPGDHEERHAVQQERQAREPVLLAAWRVDLEAVEKYRCILSEVWKY